MSLSNTLTLLWGWQRSRAGYSQALSTEGAGGGSWGCSKPWSQFLQLGVDVEMPQDREAAAPWGSTGLTGLLPCTTAVSTHLCSQAGLCPQCPGTCRAQGEQAAPSQPQFTGCQLQICDAWPLRNQLSFPVPGWDHKWGVISVAKLSCNQSSTDLLTAVLAVPPPTPQLLSCAMNCCRC